MATDEQKLAARDAHILRAIVEDYIETGDPVGSSAVAPRCEVSSATVRYVMADLEAQGLLEKPHTSAGRRPTDRGYRYYVDSLVSVKEPSISDRRLIEQGVGAGPTDESLQGASRLLHSLSRHAGLVATPRSEASRLRQIDLLRLSDGHVLAVVVTQEGRVLNKLLETDVAASPEELARASATLTQLLQSATVEELRERLARELAEERASYDELLSQALSLVSSVLVGASAAELLLSGQASLVGASELGVDRMRVLFAALEEKRRLLGLLERAVDAKAMQIFIGAESPLGEQAGVALVAAPYEVDGRLLGAVGVIGPTRMDYGRVIALVDFTAKAISRSLSHGTLVPPGE
ncbi:MAG: heat-inducible transcriptional repressor HrcA [Deltaproteobacteria bacterium]